MHDHSSLNAETVRHLAALNGFDLALERAADLVPALAEIMAADARIVNLDLGVLPAVGLPWGEESDEPDQRR
jgi:hypothetical protein